jgi:hypothetical protein
MYLSQHAQYAERSRSLRRHFSVEAVPTKDSSYGRPKKTNCADSTTRITSAMQRELPHRTRHAIRSRCRELKMQIRVPPWSASEHSKFRKLYQSASLSDLVAAFPTGGSQRLLRAEISTGSSARKSHTSRLEMRCWTPSVRSVIVGGSGTGTA